MKYKLIGYFEIDDRHGDQSALVIALFMHLNFSSCLVISYISNPK